jgi:hypothetical protein
MGEPIPMVYFIDGQEAILGKDGILELKQPTVPPATFQWNHRKIIAITGYKGCGKDTAATQIRRYNGFQHTNFADPVKELTAKMFNLPLNYFHDVALKNETLRIWPYTTPRKLLQDFAEGMRQKYPDVWVKYWLGEVRKTKNNIVVSDLRYPNELEVLKDLGAFIIRVKRDATDIEAMKDTHESESYFESMLRRF